MQNSNIKTMYRVYLNLEEKSIFLKRKRNIRKNTKILIAITLEQ